MLVRRRAGAVRDIGIASGVDHALRQDRLAPGLAFDDHPANAIAFHDRRDEHAVEHRDHARFLHQHIGDIFECLGIERVADRLRFGDRRAHCLGAILEFAADAFAVDRAGVAIPGETLDTDRGDVAAEAAVAFEQRRQCARAR